MPRGNLETIYPRALVLTSVRNHINRSEYRLAFLLCRKHRIDMNLLYDHDSTRFSIDVWVEFISQIDNIDYLNLFVTNLKDENVCISMYSKELKQKTLTKNDSKLSLKDQAVVNGKVNMICKNFKAALDQINSPRYIQTLLTTFVRQSPPDLESAMMLIKDIKTNQSSAEAESALKYVIFLVKVDKLYDVALGMYDFPLVLMVAQHSQKDPREYIPFLTDVSKLEHTLQKFTIDDFLKQHQKALKWLSASSNEDTYLD